LRTQKIEICKIEEQQTVLNLKIKVILFIYLPSLEFSCSQGGYCAYKIAITPK